MRFRLTALVLTACVLPLASCSPETRAAKQQRSSCDRGDPDACNLFATRLIKGDHVLRDPRSAATLLERACSGGVAVALYASAFTWLGLITSQAIGVGLFYIVLWEGFFARFISGVRILSIRYYALALMHGLDDRRFAALQHLRLGAALVVCALIMIGFTWLAIRRLRRMDVP